MDCPKCSKHMDDAQDGYAYECSDCLHLVCECGEIINDLQQVESFPYGGIEHLSIDYFCPKCGRRIYSADFY